ncbi:MAG TPA: DUF6493 family protein [Frankiaceae bacterium]|nr:DUF6493 family protein [Frankiaceae bacterium]
MVWRLFEVEGGGEISLANHDKFEHPSWEGAFVGWAVDGTLPRERVLRSCLAALRRDFSAYRAGWYQRTYDALAPTPEEQAAQQDDLRALLRSPITATVTMAVRRLRALGKAGLLDDAATVPALRPALLSPVKGTAVEAVRLLDDAARRGADVTDVLADALDHPHADVQRAAVRALTRLGATDVVVARAASLEPSVAAELGATPAAAAAGAPMAPAGPATPRVAPVRDDLLERLAALLEVARDAFEVESVLAALAGLTDPGVLAPLRKRAATVLSRGPREGVTYGWLRGYLARLVLVALREPADEVRAEPGTEFLAARLAEVEAVLAGGEPFAMLATPDDGWWVRPETLLRRLPERPRRYDLVAAVLRLAPDGRVPTGTGPLSYAVGGPPPRLAGTRARFGDAALWVAAARARGPLGEDPLLARAGLTGAGRALPLRAGVATRPASFESGGRTHLYTKCAVTLADAVPDAPADQPTAWAPGERIAWADEYEDWVGWLATTWPHDAEHFLLACAPSVLAAADSTMVRRDAARVLDVLAAHPGRLGPLAYATLAAGLAAKGTDQQVRAVDAVLARPLDVPSLAAAMAVVLPLCTPARWARGLGEVARGGGGPLALAALEALLPRLDRDVRGLHALVATYREEALRQGARPGAELRAWLAGFGGTSRAATTARAILEGC